MKISTERSERLIDATAVVTPPAVRVLRHLSNGALLALVPLAFALAYYPQTHWVALALGVTSLTLLGGRWLTRDRKRRRPTRVRVDEHGIDVDAGHRIDREQLGRVTFREAEDVTVATIEHPRFPLTIEVTAAKAEELQSALQRHSVATSRVGGDTPDAESSEREPAASASRARERTFWSQATLKANYRGLFGVVPIFCGVFLVALGVAVALAGPTVSTWWMAMGGWMLGTLGALVMRVPAEPKLRAAIEAAGAREEEALIEAIEALTSATE